MTRIIFVNRYFYPDHSATGQLLSELVFELAKIDYREYHVITSRQGYDDARANMPRQEVINGVHVIRSRGSKFGRASMLGRAMDYFSFYLSATRRVLGIARRHDIVIAMTDPPLLGIVLFPFLRLRGVQQINWLQDIYPEVAAEAGIRLARGRMGRLLAAIRDKVCARSARNVVLAGSMAEFLRKRGVPAHRIDIAHNWAPGNLRCVAADQNPLRREWITEPALVVGYSGNLGRVHEMHTLLNCARDMAASLDTRFLFIGGGPRLTEVRDFARRFQLPNLIIRPYQPQATLSVSLSVPDVHIVSLLPGFEGLLVPSKFYGILAVGRPVIFIGATDGAIARLVAEYDCGRVIAPGDTSGLAAAIREFAEQPEERWRDGENARRAYAENHELVRVVSQWLNLITELSIAADAN